MEWLMETNNAFAIIGLPLLPVIIISFITQSLKKNVYVFFKDRLKKLLSFFTPLIIGLLLYGIIFIIEFNLLNFILFTLGTWAVCVLGYDGIKAMFYPVKKKDK